MTQRETHKETQSNPDDHGAVGLEPSTTQASHSNSTTDRRSFLKFGAMGGAAVAAATTTPGALANQSPDASAVVAPKSLSQGRNNRRARSALLLKGVAAEQHYKTTMAAGKQPTNGDERRYRNDNYYASFTKTLPSNDYGEVDPGAFEALARATKRGRPDLFDAIPLDPSAARKLANPQGAWKFEPFALDGWGTRMPAAHTFRSPEIAAEMVEVYWQACTRDVPFIDYGSNSDIADAVSDLNAMSAPPAGGVTTGTLFRGETPGDAIGPYISQFLVVPFNFGPAANVQRYSVPTAGINFMVDVPNWLNVQRGGAPAENLVFDSTPRYIYNNRALGEYVHSDVLYQAYLNACLILLSKGPGAIDPGNPYLADITNQGAFTSLGGPMILDMVTKAANLSLNGAWFQKWNMHRYLRPEAYAGRVNFHRAGQRSYELHPDVLNSQIVAKVFSIYGNCLLPMAYTEGSPTHPSYPAGHATIAGACCTVLKAFFNEDYVFDAPVQADATGLSLLPYVGPDLTVGGELNKLANNIAIGRDAAGVHYRQDGIYGLDTGEQQAIALLQDYSRTLNEGNFDGFTLTKFDGQKIRIRNGNILPA
ncbi:MAG: vanadium-dependent haloperoxidase [Pseudomonadota bacterium]